MNLPNYLTLFRIILVPVFLTCVIYYGPEAPFFRFWALIIFFVAIMTDALDGLIARRFHLETRLGTFLDPFADKLLLLSGFLGIASSRAFAITPPLWVVIAIVFRDLLIVSGLVIIFLNVGTITVKPHFLGKITTFFQMLTIAALLLQWPISTWFWRLAAGFTILSGLIYVRRGVKIYNSRLDISK